jgi:hypothetical protein
MRGVFCAEIARPLRRTSAETGKKWKNEGEALSSFSEKRKK